jgi:methionyl-tRNA formyltransferase
VFISYARRGLIGSYYFIRYARQTPSADTRGTSVAQVQSPVESKAIDSIPRFRVPLANSPTTARVIREIQLDVVIAIGAGILRRTLLDIPEVVFINAHAGQLPQFGGMNVVEWAVFNDHPVIGTVHRIDRGIDTGEILLERPLELGAPDSISQLRESAFSGVWNMVPEAVAGLRDGTIAFRPQPTDVPRRIWYRMHAGFRVIVEKKLQTSFPEIQRATLL